MNHAEFVQKILAQVAKSPSTIPSIEMDDSRRRNAGRCMAQLICNRLSQNGDSPEHSHRTLFEWQGGMIALRNSRVSDGFWTNLVRSVEEETHSFAEQQSVAYVLSALGHRRR